MFFRWGRSGDRCVASRARVPLATVRGGGHPSLAARQPIFFLKGGYVDLYGAVWRPLRCFGWVGYLCYITGACGALAWLLLIGRGTPSHEVPLGVRLGFSRRIRPAAGTGATLVATKAETFRTDALQVRKRNPPTQINAGSEREAGAFTQRALVLSHRCRSSMMCESRR
jgi:hypothetical protein